MRSFGLAFASLLLGVTATPVVETSIVERYSSYVASIAPMYGICDLYINPEPRVWIPYVAPGEVVGCQTTSKPYYSVEFTGEYWGFRLYTDKNCQDQVATLLEVTNNAEDSNKCYMMDTDGMLGAQSWDYHLDD